MFVNQRPLAIEKRNMGNEALRRNEYKAALALYNESLNLHSMVATLKQRAIVYIHLEMHLRAIEDCNTVLEREVFNDNPLISRRSMVLSAILIIILIIIVILLFENQTR